MRQEERFTREFSEGNDAGILVRNLNNFRLIGILYQKTDQEYPMVQQLLKYENYGSIEDIQEWKGKQSAMQPRQSGCTDKNGVFHPINGIDGVPYDLCPRCEKLIANHSFGKRRNFPKYCENCGQKLDWNNKIEGQISRITEVLAREKR